MATPQPHVRYNIKLVSQHYSQQPGWYLASHPYSFGISHIRNFRSSFVFVHADDDPTHGWRDDWMLEPGETPGSYKIGLVGKQGRQQPWYLESHRLPGRDVRNEWSSYAFVHSDGPSWAGDWMFEQGDILGSYKLKLVSHHCVQKPGWYLESHCSDSGDFRNDWSSYAFVCADGRSRKGDWMFEPVGFQERVAAIPPPLAPAAATGMVLRSIDRACDEFWTIERLLAANIHGKNEDYCEKRIINGERPVCFILFAAEAVENAALAAAFESRCRVIADTREAKDARERVAFHGTHPRNLGSLCSNGLRPFGHRENSTVSPVDDGYFGSCRKGVYVSRYADYTLKYANQMIPLRFGERCQIVVFRCLPGLSKHFDSLCGPIDPTPGFDSHSSPQFLEWFLFNADQCCPTHILTIEAREDTRTASDDM